MVAVLAQRDGPHLTIVINGRFNFALHKEFFAAYKEQPDAPSSIDVDLGGVDYLDSSALGMLLALRNYFGPDVSVRLRNATGNVRRILEMASFEKTFPLE